MNISVKAGDGRGNDTLEFPKQVHRLAEPEDTEKCKDCPYPGVGFICWSSDGSCMKTDVEKISSQSRRG